MTNLFEEFGKQYSKHQREEFTLQEFLEAAKSDPLMYATPAERLLKAIGEPKTIDTSKDERLSRIFSNRTIRVYPAFEDFFGIEESIDSIVGFLKHAAQGLEEKRQILYLLGPVGSSKSSLAERLKLLAEEHPIYVLKAGDEISPVFESPLGLFSKHKFAKTLEAQYGIAERYLTGLCSPWATKRLEEFDGDISKFKVVKMMPSQLEQVGVVKTEPGDDNNQDISSLVGKVDLRKLEDLSQNDPDAYSYSGALSRGNQGIVEFVEMFKAPIKMLHPLLTATQEGNYKGTENIPAIPFSGMILAHSNESEWKSFKNNKNNEAFIDRICVVKVPYCLRVEEEIKIYKKYLKSTDLAAHPCASQTLDMLAKFTVLSRLKEPENSKLSLKMRVYNGENLKDSETRAKSYQEYREFAGVDEGMTGISTRFAFKTLNKTFNYDAGEIAADPVHLMNVLLESIKQEQYPEETEHKLIRLIQDELAPDYVEWLGSEIQRAYIEEYHSYGQNVFDRYVAMADAWIQENDFKDPDTGNMLDKERVNDELTKIEKPAGIINPKDFRHEIVNFCLRYQASNGGKNPNWTSYEKMREVIEKKMFSAIDEILPVISFGSKKDKKSEKDHSGFVARMKDMGYTEKQIKRLVEYYSRARNSR
jgi:serine protein kinase